MIAIRSRSVRALIAVALSTGMVSSCSGDPPAATIVVPEVFDLHHDPAADVVDVDVNRTDVLPAGSLRAALERELVWHGVTLVEMMRAARRDDPQLQAWIDAIVQNTDDLVAAVGLVYGPITARAFDQQWAQHTQFLLDYAVAVRDGDDDAADLARSNLTTYATDAGSFFSTATDGALPADAVQQLLQTHIGHMYDMLAADVDGDIDGTLHAALQDNDYLLTIANGLATAMAGQQPQAFPGDVDTPVSMFCTIVTGQTSGYLLTDLISDQPAVVHAAAAAFGEATGTPIADVLGPSAPLSSNDLETVASTAKGMLDKALSFATRR